jgi:hypothetical protein
MPMAIHRPSRGEYEKELAYGRRKQLGREELPHRVDQEQENHGIDEPL